MSTLITIEAKRPHRARLSGVTDEVRSAVDRALSFPIEGAFFMKGRSGRWDWDGRQHLFSEALGTFPTGLLHLAEATLLKLKADYKVVDNRGLKPLPGVKADCLEGITLAPHQVDAVNMALGFGGGILHVATNGGKTECGAAIVKAVGGQVLWIVPTRVLLKQTRERIAKRLGVGVHTIGAIGGGKFEPLEITVAIAAALAPRKAKNVVDVARKKALRDYLKTLRVLILDETHHAGSQAWYRTLSSCSAPHRFGMSGTPLDRSDGRNMLVQAICGKVVAKVTNQHLIDIGWSAKPTVEVMEIEKPALPNAISWQDAYKHGIVHNAFRNNAIALRTLEAINQDQPVLILCREIEHINQLKEALIKVGFYSGEVGIAFAGKRGLDETITSFANGFIHVLISSPVLGEGVDFPGDRIQVLINAEGLKSRILTLQHIGRGMRKKTGAPNKLRMVEFADLSQAHLAKHSLDRIKTYEQEGFTIIDRPIPVKTSKQTSKPLGNRRRLQLLLPNLTKPEDSTDNEIVQPE